MSRFAKRFSALFPMEHYQKTVIKYLKNTKRKKVSSIIMKNLSLFKVRNS